MIALAENTRFPTEEYRNRDSLGETSDEEPISIDESNHRLATESCFPHGTFHGENGAYCWRRTNGVAIRALHGIGRIQEQP